MKRTLLTTALLLIGITVSWSRMQPQTNTNQIKPGNHSSTMMASCNSWTTQATGFTATSRGIEGIEIVNANVAWALAYDGSGAAGTFRDYTRTINGGTTWVPGTINVGSASYGISSISPIHADTAWASIYPTTATVTAQGIYKTTNGGTTWTRQATALYNTATSFINFVHFFNANDGVSQGDPAGGYFEIYITNNGGVNWTRVNTSNIPTILASDEYGTVGYFTTYGDKIWFLTNKGRIFRSSDKGATWAASSTPLGTAVTFTNIAFRDANNGFITGVDPSTSTDVGLYKTTDGGITWTQLTTNTQGISVKSAIEYVPGTAATYYISGAATGSYGTAITQNDGATWTLIDNIQHTALGFLNDSVGWSGGFNTSSTVGGIFKIVVQKVPATISTPSATSFCAGESVLLSANAGTSLTYQWYLNGTAITNSVAQTHSATSAGTYTVEVFDGPCSGISNAVVLTLNPNPNPPTIIGFNNFCQGDSTTLQTPIATSYQWYKNTLPISGAIANKLVVKESGTYNVRVSNSFGCFGNSLDFVVIVTPLPAKPIVSNSSGSSNLCEGDELTLNSSVVSNIQWYKNDVPIQGATLANLLVKTTGNYYVRASTPGSDCAINSDVNTLIFNPIPVKPTISRVSNTLTSSVAASYQWFKNKVEMPSVTTREILVTSTGSYTVKIFDLNGCSNLSEGEIVIVTGISSDMDLNIAKIYPNPSNGNITLQYALDKATNVNVKVVNVLGKVVAEIYNDVLQNKGMHEINITQNEPGIYFLQLNTVDGNQVLKFIVK